MPMQRGTHPVYVMYDPARTTDKKTSAQTGKAVWSWISGRLVVWELRPAGFMPGRTKPIGEQAMEKGDLFQHAHWLDSSKMPEHVPLTCKVTKVERGMIYYRPYYGKHDDGSEWLGSPAYFPIEQIGHYVRKD
jgi:hypothetical protein